MTFDITDCARINSSRTLRLRDCHRLPCYAWGSEGNFIGTVVVQPCAADYGVNSVAICNRILKAAQGNDTGAMSKNSPTGIDIKRATVTIAAHHPTFLIHITAFLRESDRNAASKCRITLITQQTLARLSHRHQRRRTSSRNCHRWPRQT